MKRASYKLSTTLQLLPATADPKPSNAPLRVWRSRDFLVQEYAAPAPALVRLSVNITSHNGSDWDDGITWDQLQDIKAQCGYPWHTAVEVYPSTLDVVNVANMRHLWVPSDHLPFAWRKDR